VSFGVGTEIGQQVVVKYDDPEPLPVIYSCMPDDGAYQITHTPPPKPKPKFKTVKN
jgi:hypothetical protein